ncbi:MAG: tetratricopeptide repeat protein [Polyangiales bacterium]
MSNLTRTVLCAALAALLLPLGARAQRRPTAAQRVAAAMRRCDTDAPRECVRAINALPAAARRAPDLQALELRARFEALEVALEPDGARALDASKRGELSRIDRAVTQLTERAPEQGIAWLLRGRVALVSNALEPAAAALERAAQLLTRDPSPSNDLAMVLVALRRLPDAERALTRATSLAPNDAEPWSNLGGVRLARGNSRSAADAFREAIRCAPTVARHVSDLGSALLAAGQAEQAARAFGDAVRLAPTDPTVRANLGYALAVSGHLDDALAELRRATELGPRSSAAWNNLAIVLARRGDNTGAETALRRALEIDPNDARARANLDALVAARPPLSRGADAGR